MWIDVQVSAGGGEGAGHPGYRRAEPADKRSHLHPGNLGDTSIHGTVTAQVGTGTTAVYVRSSET